YRAVPASTGSACPRPATSPSSRRSARRPIRPSRSPSNGHTPDGAAARRPGPPPAKRCCSTYSSSHHPTMGVAMRLVAPPVAVCLLCSDPAAHAQPPDAEAARARATALTKDAARAYQNGDYGTALARFQDAYAVFPSPRLLFNLGQTYERLSRFVEAT